MLVNGRSGSGIATVHERAGVGDAAGQGRGGRGQGAGQEGPPAGALAALEVAVGGRHRVLAGGGWSPFMARHRAAGLAPLGPGGPEHLGQALGLGLALDVLGAGHDQHPHPRVDLAAAQQPGRLAQVGDARVGAGADEDHVHRPAQQGLARAQVHVGERLGQGLAGGRVAGVLGVGHPAGDGRPHARVGAVGDHRLQRRRPG